MHLKIENAQGRDLAPIFGDLKNILRLATFKVEKILKGSLNSIPSPSVKIQKLWAGKFA